MTTLTFPANVNPEGMSWAEVNGITVLVRVRQTFKNGKARVLPVWRYEPQWDNWFPLLGGNVVTIPAASIRPAS